MEWMGLVGSCLSDKGSGFCCFSYGVVFCGWLTVEVVYFVVFLIVVGLFVFLRG